MYPCPGLLSRPGPSSIGPGLSSLATTETVFTDFTTRTFLDAFAPDPSSGSLRVPLLIEKKRNELRVGLLGSSNIHDFLETVERLMGEAQDHTRHQSPCEERSGWSVGYGREKDTVSVALRSEDGKIVELQKSGDLKSPWIYQVGAGWRGENLTAVQTLYVDHDRRILTGGYELVFKGPMLKQAASALGFKSMRSRDVFLLGGLWHGFNNLVDWSLPSFFLPFVFARTVYASHQFPALGTSHELVLYAKNLLGKDAVEILSPVDLECAVKTPTAEVALFLSQLEYLRIWMSETEPEDEDDDHTCFGATGEREQVRVSLRPPRNTLCMPLVPDVREVLWNGAVALVSNHFQIGVFRED